VLGIFFSKWASDSPPVSQDPSTGREQISRLAYNGTVDLVENASQLRCTRRHGLTPVYDLLSILF
jgi:hypothetical protein